MKTFFYVYKLVSKANETIHYTGSARKFEERLLEHNRGACAHASKYRPWRVETAIAFKSETKAHKFEKYLKTRSGREFARRHFF
jgi:putative endonuclease